MSRYIAPAGAPIGPADLGRWANAALAPGNVSQRLRDVLSARFGKGHYFLSSTGRAGMTLLLRAMRRLSPADRDEVVIPSYTCYSVAASAVKAGLKVRLVDIDPHTLDYAPAELARTDFRRVVALVATNLYGFPSDLPALSRLARGQGVFLIDDAAQAMGASVGGRPSGTWGDAGLFSFDKGKNVSAIDGGVVFTASEELAEALRMEWGGLPVPGAVATAVYLVKVLGYALMLRPQLYGIPARIPEIGLGRTVFTSEFPLSAPSAPQTVLVATMMPRLEAFTAARRANAEALLAGLASIRSLSTITPAAGSAPAYLRLPVLCATHASREASIVALTAAGIGATGSYPAALLDVPEVQRVMAGGSARGEGGRHVAHCILTLPTHPFVGGEDVSLAVETLRALERVAAGGPSHATEVAGTATGRIR